MIPHDDPGKRTLDDFRFRCGHERNPENVRITHERLTSGAIYTRMRCIECRRAQGRKYVAGHREEINRKRSEKNRLAKLTEYEKLFE